MSRELEQRGSGLAMAPDPLGTKPRSFNKLVRTMFAISKLGNSAGGGVIVDLDFSHDKITNSVGYRAMRLIGMFAVNGLMPFGQEARKDLFSKLYSRCSKTKRGMEVDSLLLNWDRGRK